MRCLCVHARCVGAVGAVAVVVARTCVRMCSRVCVCGGRVCVCVDGGGPWVQVGLRVVCVCVWCCWW